MNKPPKADNYKRTNAYFEMLKPLAQNSPNMSIYVNEACTWINGKLVEYIGGNSPTIIAPGAGLSKWTLVSLTSLGTLVTTDSTPVANPNVLPDPPANVLPIFLIFIKATDTKITNDMIFDVRPFLDTQYLKTHNLIATRNEPDSHPISSITQLTEELAKRPDFTQIDTVLADKANVAGTTSTDFTFNSDETGSPTSNINLWVNRGSQSRVGIMWNEVEEKWKYTNDGTTWTALGFDGLIPTATASVIGTTKLSVAPASPSDPIAVGDNDPRLGAIALKADASTTYTKTEVDTSLALKSDATTTYTKTETDTKIDLKANISTTYTKTEVDTSLALKVDSSALVNYATKTGSDDIEITDITKGIILHSPDNTRYRITVANGGTLTAVAVV